MSGELRKIRATANSSLRAKIIRRVAMHYEAGADEALDRPGHVRAASSVTWLGNRVAVVQDDANFVALVDPATGLAHAVTLPAGKDDLRQFDDGRGNKKHKLDLEAMTQVPIDGGTMLVAFGSGSKKRRQSVLTLAFTGKASPFEPSDLMLTALPDLYDALRSEKAFSGSDMNIEGALFVDGRIRLFGRGNGKAEDDLLPVDATCDLNWSELQAHISNPERHPVPTLSRITQYEFGEVNGISLGFTDAVLARGSAVLFSAAAEASDDARSDGVVGGSALGVLPNDRKKAVNFTALLDETGAVFDGKVEGVVLYPLDPTRALIVVDIDDHERPAELCEVQLDGPWWS
jgi:hypothetical protein